MNDNERFEFKFLVTARQRDDIFATFNGALQPDLNGGSSGDYPVVSLYYDTPDWRCYWEAWRGVPSRRKLRVRIYGTACGGIPPTSFVEVKHKLDGLGVKRRVQTTLERALEIGQGGGEPSQYTAAEARIVREVQRLVRNDGFRPVCTIRYRRHAFALQSEQAGHAGNSEPLRITFDDELAARFRDLQPQPDDRGCDLALLPPENLVMEVKGMGAVPAPVANYLAKSGLSPRRFSKYCAALHISGTHRT
jgi:hypothetical protein